MLIDVSEARRSPAVLKVLGLGGAGGNAVNRMLASEIRGVEFLVANTDVQALNASLCPLRIQIGAEVTNGLGSGGDPRLGRESAEEDLDALREHLKGADMVFIAGGMGGGTGTGASPVVAKAARESGALTVGIVTKPFTFEGRRRMRQAEEGLDELRGVVDTLIVIPNQRLLHVVDKATPLNEALRVADDVLTHATKGISEIITVPGMINVDFADVRSIMTGMGNALMGMGFGHGPDRAREAADMAICSPLLEDISISGAEGLLVNFMGGEDMTLAEVDEASTVVLEAAGADANVIFGAVIDPSIKDEIRVTLIATGFGNGAAAAQHAAAQMREPLTLSSPEPAPQTMTNPAFGCEQRAVREVNGEPIPQPVAQPMQVRGTQNWGLKTEPRSLDLEDGVVGRARPIRSSRGGATGAVATQLESPPAQSAEAAAAPLPEPSVPSNVVPLVWKKNLPGKRLAPKMSSRWQRVLRRDQLDVPSFMRRRQMD